jgi:hypothetical protein
VIRDPFNVERSRGTPAVGSYFPKFEILHKRVPSKLMKSERPGEEMAERIKKA